MGPDSKRSSPLPCGTPSKMSIKTTSASCLSASRCATVAPTFPEPTTVTFFRISPPVKKRSQWQVASKKSKPMNWSRLFACHLPLATGHCFFAHVFDNSIGECAGAELFGAGYPLHPHQAFEVVGDAMLGDGGRKRPLDEHTHFGPSDEFEHQRPGTNERAGVDDVLVGVLGRRAVRGFKNPVPVADVPTGRETQPANLRRAGVGKIVAVQVGVQSTWYSSARVRICCSIESAMRS